MSGSRSSFSAAEQGLGYVFQSRLALLKMFEIPEGSAVFFEKEDDIEFVDESGARSLASLKHKAQGDKLTNLATDFWKSVRIWLVHYLNSGRIGSQSRFMLLTTASISDGSFLSAFTNNRIIDTTTIDTINSEINKSRSKLIADIRQELAVLTEAEQRDFYSRISIFGCVPRITDIPKLVDAHLRTIRRESRAAIFERLEGWWTDLVIKALAGERQEPIYGNDVFDKLSFIADEYRTDNLPITLRGRVPAGQIDTANDPRLFVDQLRALDLSVNRIRNAIIDYYRAFEQRSSWARESLLVSGEIEEYEDRLVDEWGRYREIILETLTDPKDDDACLRAGRELYRWAEIETTTLRIRERVTEPYVVRGAFHILANASPRPRVYWHPHFLQRLERVLEVTA